MVASPRATLVLVSAPDALPGLDEGFRAIGVRIVRIPVLDFLPRPVSLLRGALTEFGTFDTLVVTSSEVVTAFVRPLSRLIHAQGPSLEIWAAGPTTARALRDRGFLRVHQAAGLGALPIVEALRRSRPRSVVYPRSDRAGPGVARTLRRRGDRVLDLVSYSVRSRTRLTPREVRALADSDAWIMTSPSAISALRSALGNVGLRSMSRAAQVWVLGERTRRAARGHGIHGARSIGGVTTQEITYYVSRWCEHGADERRRVRASASTASTSTARRRTGPRRSAHAPGP
jgi:uroporphyrinogen-III synthase